MSYCTSAEVDQILANALTSANDPSSSTKRKLLSIGNVRDKNVIPESTVDQYILWSGNEIDSSLSELYKTPFCEVADFEADLFSDITEYNSFIVLEEVCPLNPGDTVVLTDGINEERHTIDDQIAPTVYSTVDPILVFFDDGSRLIRVKFPDPIPWVCARLAAANIYDKYFASQVAPGISEYGKNLRNQARQKLNDVLNGRAILHGVHRIGRSLWNPNISDQYGLPHGTEGAKDIDRLE